MSSIRQQSRSRAKHPEPRRPAHPPHRAAREAGGTRNPARFFSFVSGRLTRPGEAHPDHGRRWAVGLPYSGFHLLLALFAPLLVQLFVALPVPVIAILTGLALIPAFVSAAEAMLGGSAERNPALLSFLATASGVSLLGIGSAFWGLLAGFSAFLVRRLAAPRPCK